MKVFFIGFSANYVVLLMEVKKGPYPICMRNTETNHSNSKTRTVTTACC